MEPWEKILTSGTRHVFDLIGQPKRCGAQAFCRLVVLLFLLVGSSYATYAQNGVEPVEKHPDQPRLELGEIVVTAARIDESIRRIPRNVTVITSGDIEQAGSNNLVDLLARESGIRLRSLFGHDKTAGVDMRGMGDTAASNVIVMVDGVRLNSPDLAGPDLSGVPLNSIERIEIVRGAGSVVYGDGAVGGVINIITKKAEKQPEARVYASYGSYETFDSRVAYSGKDNRFGLNLNAAYYDSDGYRDNGYLRKKDVIGRFGYDLGDHVILSVSSSYHCDENGLPGGVSKEDQDSEESRTSTDRPDDSGDTTDRRYVGATEIDLETWGNLAVQRGYRLRDNSYVMGFSPLLTREDQTDTIDEDTRNLGVIYSKDFTALDLNQQLRFGVDQYETEYVREERSKDQRENGDTDSLGVFLAGDCSLLADLSLRLGYRHNDFDGDFRTDKHQLFGSTQRWVNGEPSKREWTNDAGEVGLVYSLRPDTDLFASYATSFRVPNVDELAQAQGDLKPQEGKHVDIGGRIKYGKRAEFAVTIFEMRIDDEIFFDGDLQVNRNFGDKTVRRGIETDVRLYVTDALYLWGNYTYTHAKFDSRDTWVPLVPEHMASGGLEWQVHEPLAVSVTGTYVGPRFDGNDENNNRFDKLDGYSVLDTKVIYRWKGVKFFAGVNNVLNKLYSTVAYSETYYPMPDRNFYGGVEWTF
jgi:iron complex outermembrane receptor protein